MFSAGVLGVAMIFNGLGYYQLKKAKVLGELFLKTKKLQAFSFNYIESISHIAKRDQIALAVNLPPSEISKFTTYINIKNLKQDHYYVRHSGDFEFKVHSEKNGFMTIKNKGKKTRIYNITQEGKYEDKISKITQFLTPLQRISSIFGLLNIYEYNLSNPGQQYVMIGNVIQKEQKEIKNGDEQIQEPVMEVEAILGENRDSYLQFLDWYILQIRKKQHIYFGIGISTLFIHFIIFKYGQFNKKQDVVEEMK